MTPSHVHRQEQPGSGPRHRKRKYDLPVVEMTQTERAELLLHRRPRRDQEGRYWRSPASACCTKPSTPIRSILKPPPAASPHLRAEMPCTKFHPEPDAAALRPAIGVWVAWSDMKSMKIPNKAVLATLAVWVVVGLLAVALHAGLPGSRLGRCAHGSGASSVLSWWAFISYAAGLPWARAM